ncbi:MAG TPA: prolipoprotein diacylglyceryl transferase family protein [Telluria sp.]|nr:prolipoprotein diacylglyceryl transferase family protein [Telluria sp.]
MKSLLLSADAAHTVHLLSEWAAIAVGFQLYRLQRARAGQAGVLQPGSYAVVLGCILGAAIGNKLVFWCEFPHLWASRSADIGLWMSGQSIVGGLLGGLLGVEIAKKLTGARRSTGDQFVLPLVAGTVVGRIGCFLAGLYDGTYGNPTDLPWAVDFGDGVGRHPTQLYDIAFVLCLGALVLKNAPRWRAKPGLVFKLYLSGYLLWRLLIDSIKPVPYAYSGGLSGIQLVCLLALLCYLPFVIKQWMEPHRDALSFR